LYTNNIMAKQAQPRKEKSLEQKVQELILKKLYIKVDEDELVIDKANFVLLILRDLISLAKSDFDIEDALKLMLEENEKYRAIPEIKRRELQQSAVEFKVEADAYRTYLACLKADKPDELILSEVHNGLNSEPELLDQKLRDLIIESLSDKITEEQTAPMGIDRWELIGKYCDYIQLIAESESIDQAVDKLMVTMNLTPEEFDQKKESLKEGMMRIASFAGEEIDAAESAISMRNRNAEYYKILTRVKEELGFE
jgi:hypothetical protein